MDKIKKEEIKKVANRYQEGLLHFLLAYSYLSFLFTIILGVLFDLILDKKLFSNNIYQYLGVFMLIVSTIFIMWAQKVSSHKNKKSEEELKKSNKTYLERGPYRFLRNPTQFGLFIMTVGFGFIINSFFSVLFAVATYIFLKLSLLKKQNKILEERHGEIFDEYKKKVSNWI